MILCVAVLPKSVGATMAASRTIDNETFDDLIEELIADQAIGLGNDNQSDVEVSISVSSVHTSDLSDFDDVESSSSDHEDFSTEWSDTVVDHEPHKFTHPVGPTVPLGPDARPVDYFLQLFPPTMLKKISDETNRYAEQKGATSFQATSEDEISAYLGMLFLMGVIQLPNYRCYWSTKPELRQESIARYYELCYIYHHFWS